jgi:lipopolysaccharide export system protein LptA
MSLNALSARLLLCGALAVAAASALRAQTTATGVPNALQGFSVNRDKPIRINATTLEVREKEKRATFSGNVHMVQGDTTMKSKTLEVYYDDDGAAPAPAQQQQGQLGQQQIRLLEAKGDVLVTQKDQTVTGETGLFDVRANTVRLTGNVVITQCSHVVRGDLLTVDLTTGVSRVESGKPGEGRVEALLMPLSTSKGGKGDPNCKEGPKPAAKAGPQRPMRLN